MTSCPADEETPLIDRMKHRFSERLGEWLQLLREMGVVTKKNLTRCWMSATKKINPESA
jgi:hypothetical protein